jgi:hypothetical protein
MVLAGMKRSVIVQYSSEKWGFGERNVDKYLKIVQNEIEKRRAVNMDFEFGKSIERYEEIFARCFKDGDYRGCILAQKEIDRLTGNDHIDITVRTESATPEEVVAFMKSWLEKPPKEHFE